jgi:hypothetical protein
MSEPQNKPLLLALGAAGSLLLAISSRRSKQKAAQERRERCRAAQEAAQIIIDETSRHSDANRNQNTSRHFGIRGQSRHLGIGGAPLLIHGLLSLIILYTLPYWQSINAYLQSAYQETIAFTLVAFLTLHILIAFISPTFFPSRHLQLASTVITADASTGIARPESILELNGVWTKDKEESDSMDPVCDLMQLPRLIRLAVGMISGVEIITDPTDSFQLNVLSGIMWFKIKEKYRLSGEEARHRRRDFRGGMKKIIFLH